MIKVTIDIDTENDAFSASKYFRDEQIKLVMRSVEERFDLLLMRGRIYLHDINGNKVGCATLEES